MTTRPRTRSSGIVRTDLAHHARVELESAVGDAIPEARPGKHGVRESRRPARSRGRRSTRVPAEITSTSSGSRPAPIALRMRTRMPERVQACPRAALAHVPSSIPALRASSSSSSPRDAGRQPGNGRPAGGGRGRDLYRHEAERAEQRTGRSCRRSGRARAGRPASGAGASRARRRARAPSPRIGSTRNRGEASRTRTTASPHDDETADDADDPRGGRLVRERRDPRGGDDDRGRSRPSRAAPRPASTCACAGRAGSPGAGGSPRARFGPDLHAG